MINFTVKDVLQLIDSGIIKNDFIESPGDSTIGDRGKLLVCAYHPWLIQNVSLEQAFAKINSGIPVALYRKALREVIVEKDSEFVRMLDSIGAEGSVLTAKDEIQRAILNNMTTVNESPIITYNLIEDGVPKAISLTSITINSLNVSTSSHGFKTRYNLIKSSLISIGEDGELTEKGKSEFLDNLPYTKFEELTVVINTLDKTIVEIDWEKQLKN